MNSLLIGNALFIIDPSVSDLAWAAAQDVVKVVLINPCKEVFLRALDLMLERVEIQDMEINEEDPKIVLGIC